MKIQESSVNLSASHEASSSRRREVESELSFRRLFGQLAETPADNPQNRQAELQKQVREMLESLVAAILAAMDGKTCRKNAAADAALPSEDKSATPSEAEVREFTWQTRVREWVSESESTRVCGNGVVKTCDGREIAFDFSVAMQRDYSKETLTEEGGSVQLRDPLVLSFAGKSCALENERFAFDLDADGSAEWLPGLSEGSCFLVFDRNGNGRADNGKELFGSQSGNGFADLAKLDGDGNGWIDEADTAFSQLALWSGERFQSLAEQGVGALCTAAVDAPFSLKTSDNELLGQIRAAGVYLLESGGAGLMQQVDLASSDVAPATQEPDQGEQLRA